VRSIGKVRIKKLKAIVQEEAKGIDAGSRFHYYGEYAVLVSRIRERIPEEWYDTWEMATQEIDRIMCDFINEIKYGRTK